MIKKTTVKLISLVVILMLMLTLAACGAENVKDSYVTEDNYGEYLGDGTASGSSTSADAGSNTLKESRKIIETLSFSVQTKSFDELLKNLEEKALSVGGYIEQTDVYGNEYDYTDARSAHYVFRIPSEKSDEFTAFVDDNSTVTNRSVVTEDVTLEYVDLESRISALETEKESLEELLESAGTVSEIIEIRDMLTEVIYEIESYQSQLRVMDNLVDFTTVNIDIEEVEYTSVVNKQTPWQRIGSNFIENCRNLWDFLVEVFVFIISAIPYILFLGLIGFAIIIIVKLSAKKSRKAKKADKKPDDKKEIENKTE